MFDNFVHFFHSWIRITKRLMNSHKRTHNRIRITERFIRISFNQLCWSHFFNLKKMEQIIINGRYRDLYQHLFI